MRSRSFDRGPRPVALSFRRGGAFLLTKGNRKDERMSVFKDCNGDEWRVQLDAFAIADAKKETGIDLADITAGGWHAVATDASAVGRILAVVCADEIQAKKINGRQFAKLIRGAVIEAGRKALLDEGADFFPPSEWSAIRANSNKRTKQAAQTEAMEVAKNQANLIPLLEAFTRLPPNIQERLLTSGGDTSSLISEDNESVAGQTDIPLTLPIDLQVSAELTAVG